jgi:hypothetical protein
MKPVTAIEDDWPFLLTLLPADLEASAKETGALQRKRGVASAAALLRLAFAYAYCGLSLRGTVLWAQEAGVACLSEVALFKRLRGAADWCGRLLAHLLAQRAALRRELLPAGLKVRLVDATAVSKPGSQGTDYRLHLELDLGTLTITDLTLTDAHGGESLKQYPLTAGEIAVGDRGYAHRQGIAAAVAAGADVLVRLNWQNVPLTGREGSAFDLLAALRGLAPAQLGEWEVATAPARDGTPAVAGRLLGVRVSAKAAEAARRKVRAAARKKGKTPDARTLEACDYLFVFTTVSAERLAASAVLELYRFRWQIELAFKRLKSLLALDDLAAKDDRFCRTFLAIKLLGALLVEQLSHRWVDFSPWGYGPPAAGVGVAGVPSRGGDAPPGGGRGADDRPLGAGGGEARAVAARHAPPPPLSGAASHGLCPAICCS